MVANGKHGSPSRRVLSLVSACVKIREKRRNGTVKCKTILSLMALTALATGMNVAQAFDFGDMMNPSDWFGGNHHDRDYYDRGYYGGYGPYGWGGGPYGWGGGPYGWGGGYPGAIVVNPNQGSSTPPPPKTPE
jgi:CubicO group peptidase (beta-lactamase class C family)